MKTQLKLRKTIPTTLKERIKTSEGIAAHFKKNRLDVNLMNSAQKQLTTLRIQLQKEIHSNLINATKAGRIGLKSLKEQGVCFDSHSIIDHSAFRCSEILFEKELKLMELLGFQCVAEYKLGRPGMRSFSFIAPEIYQGDLLLFKEDIIFTSVIDFEEISKEHVDQIYHEHSLYKSIPQKYIDDLKKLNDGKNIDFQNQEALKGFLTDHRTTNRNYIPDNKILKSLQDGLATRKTTQEALHTYYFASRFNHATFNLNGLKKYKNFGSVAELTNYFVENGLKINSSQTVNSDKFSQNATQADDQTFRLKNGDDFIYLELPGVYTEYSLREYLRNELKYLGFNKNAASKILESTDPNKKIDKPKLEFDKEIDPRSESRYLKRNGGLGKS